MPADGHVRNFVQPNRDCRYVQRNWHYYFGEHSNFMQIKIFHRSLSFASQPFCIVHDILNELFSKRLNQRSESNNNSHQRLQSNVIVRCTISAIMTVSIALMRMFVIDFQSPEFKEPDNPIAAADDISTKV